MPSPPDTSPGLANDTMPATGLSSTPGDYGFAPGATLGRYVVLERMGGGGMGVVYAAYDPKLDRRVALKLLRPDASGSQDAQRRLLREGQTLARLAHPNVVAVHDVGQFEGAVFVDMELVKGKTLTQWMAAEARGWRAIVDVFVQAGRGLAAAHAVGIVHRDFKPDNVLVGDDARVRVVDFGIALLARAEPTEPMPVDAPVASPRGETDDPVVSDAAGRTQAGVVLGTLSYMAPEQLRGQAADARSDQFSFCVALAEALYGEHPFARAPPDAFRAGTAEPTFGRSSRAPAWVRAPLARGLRMDPDGRFASIEALLAALARDPWAGTVRVLAASVLFAVGAVAAFGAVRLRHERTLQCASGEERLAGAWDDERRQAASRAFAAVDRPFAGAAWERARAALDGYAREWVRAYKDNCEATHVRGEQSAALLDQRTACLNERRKGLAAVADVFAHADVAVVTNALSAVDSLPSLAACSDARALSARVKPPEPGAMARVEALSQELASLRALAAAGKKREAGPRARTLADDAAATGYVPLEAEARLLDGKLRVDLGDYAGGEVALRGAIRAADTAGDDLARVAAYAKLIDDVGLREAKHDIVPILVDEAEAALARQGGDEVSRAELDQSLGGVLIAEGKLDEALGVEQRALATWERIRGPQSREAGRALGNIGVVYDTMGDTDKALDAYERSLAIETTALGPDHPDLLTELHNIANIHQMKLEYREAAGGFERCVLTAERSVGADHPMFGECLDGQADALVELGEVERGLRLHERALAIKEKALGPDNPQRLYALTGVGGCLTRMGRPEKAIAYLERAVALPSTGYEGDVATTKFELARALVGAGRDAARARRLATEARDTLRKTATLPAEKATLADVDRWLAGAH